MPRPWISLLAPALALLLGLLLQPLLSSFTPSSLIIVPSALTSIPETSLAFLDALAHRRSVYTLSNTSTISDAHLISILEHAIEKTPAAFGSYTTRIVLLLRDAASSAAFIGEEGGGVVGGAQDRLWDLMEKALRQRYDEKEGKDEKEWEETSKKINAFRGAYGTVSLPVLHRCTASCRLVALLIIPCFY